MRIDCPNCGLRPLDEFVYKGDAGVKRPNLEDDKDHLPWVDYVYMRNNSKGWHSEYWHHSGGCRAWLKIERHTVHHTIRSIALTQTTGDAEPS